MSELLAARAQAILHDWVQSESLRKHCYAVADSMKHFAQLHGPDADLSGVSRKTPLEKTLYAVDELSSFVVAVALVRPTKSIRDVDVRAVKKKMKDKAFARAVSRDDITRGAEELGVDLDEHIRFVTESLKPVAAELGLNP